MRATSFLRSERAAALVEFAIVLPVLLLLVFGIIDFGRALNTQNNLTAAVREGARRAAVQYPTVNNQAIRDSVRKYLQPLGGEAPDVRVDQNVFDGTVQSITVAVDRYPFRPVTPIAEILGLETIPISASATFRWEFGGQ